MSTERPLFPREVAGLRIQEVRKRRGLTAEQLASRCRELGAEHVTRQFVANIESCRRGLSLDDLLVFALALDVAPVALLELREERDEVATPTTTVRVADAQQWRNWLIGDAALDVSDAQLYYGAALEKMQAPDGQALSAYARAVVQKQHRDLVSFYEERALDLLSRTRAQALNLIDDIQAEVASGAPSERILHRLADIRAGIAGQQVPPQPPVADDGL